MTGARVVIAAVVVALGVSACSGSDPEPKLAPPTSSSAPSGPSTSPTSAAPALGPEETFAAWIDARNEALRSGDVTAVEGLSSASCRTCRNAIAPIKKVYANGGHFDTSGWQIVASHLKSQEENAASVSAGIKYAAGETVPKTGAAPVAYGVERHIVVVDLVQEDGQWLVQFIGYLS